MIRSGILLLFLAAAARPEEAPNLARVMPAAGKVPIPEAIRTAVDFLVKNQNSDGSFGRHVSGRTYELWCQVPGGHRAFQAATTALCWLGLNDAPIQPRGSRTAQERALAWLARHARVRRPFPEQFYNVWSFGYGMRALSQALRKQAPGAEPAAMRATVASILKEVALYQSPDGGWGYLDFKMPGLKPSWSTSFTTATILVGLAEARRAGFTLPPGVAKKATRLLWRMRTPDGNYIYSIDWKWRPAGRINRPQGSSMRNQACNLALHLFDPERMDAAKLRIGLEQLVKNHRFAIAGVRRPRPHESWYLVSGYFYLYGQQYAALVLDRLPEADRRRFAKKVATFVLKTRQPDGSFWDYPTYGYHKFYGTGYALIALSRLSRH